MTGPRLAAFRHRHGALVAVALGGLGVFTALRVGLLVRAWGQYPPDLLGVAGVLVTGALYDLAFLSLALAPAAWWLALVPERAHTSVAHRALGSLCALAALYGVLFIAVAEWVFWGEFGTRFNFIAVDYLIYSDEVLGNIRESYPVPLVLAALAAGAVLLGAALRRPLGAAAGSATPVRRRLAAAGGWTAVALGFAALLGQGPREQFANQYLAQAAGNGPWQFFHALRAAQLDYAGLYVEKDPEAMDAVLRAQLQKPGTRFMSQVPFDLTRRVTAAHPARPLNVMLVVVESLSAKYLGAYGNPDHLTPNLDRLAGQSLWFTRLYATGTRTVRGLEAITLSVPPTPGEAIVKRPDHAGFYSLGQVLRARGYDTRFLYGGYGYFDNMNAFFSSNGFDVVDRRAFAPDQITFANIWGVADENLYAKAVETADTSYRAGRPFFSLVMTTSNHRPYTYPQGRVAIPPHTGREGAVQYTDWAIGHFLERARAKSWFRDTLFVFVADHCAGSDGRTALPVDRYHIPALVYAPAHVAPRQVATLASQIDLAPTLLGLLGGDYVSRFFGQDLLAPDAQPRALIGNYEHLGLLTPDDLTVLSPNRVAQVFAPAKASAGTPLAPNDARLAAAVAWYQGAAQAYREHLDRWDDALLAAAPPR